MNTKDKIAVMQAYEEGRETEYRCFGEQLWLKLTGCRNPVWNWSLFEYRTTPPIPKKIETVVCMVRYLNQFIFKIGSVEDITALGYVVVGSTKVSVTEGEFIGGDIPE